MVRRSAAVAALLLIAVANAVAQTPPSERLRQGLQRAESLERARRYSLALSELGRLLADWPAQPSAILAYERISRRLGELERVLPVLDRAIAASPGLALPRQVQLRVLADLGRVNELREAGDRWVRVAPRLELSYREYAAALQRVGATQEAEGVLRAGLGRVARPDGLTAELADLYLTQRRWSDAAGQWLVLLEREPEMSWDLISYKLESLGPQAGHAAAAILERLPGDQESPDRLKLAAVAALYAGREPEARENAEAALALLPGPERRAFVLRFARVADARRRPGLVAWAYRRMLGEAAADSTRWVLARQVVRYELSAGDTAAALATLKDLVQRSDSAGAALRWASALQIRLFAAGGESERAERAFDGYAQRYGSDPELAPLALAVARADMRRGRLDEAAAVLDRIPASANRGAVGARVAASRAYLALFAGRYDDARAGFETAAESLSGAERSDALRVLRFLRHANRAELAALAAAQRALLGGERLDAFERLIEGLRDAPPSDVRAGLLLWAGELALEAGALARGEAVMAGIPERYPDSGEAAVSLLELAEALAAAGRRAEAIARLERLILDYPDSGVTPLGRRRLAELKGEVFKS